MSCFTTAVLRLHARHSHKPGKPGAAIAATLLIGFTSCASLFLPTLAQTVSYPLSLSTGWNLAGNSTATPMDVKTGIGAQAGIQSVWKWDPTGSRWAFYAPSLDTAGTLASYAAANGYNILSTINPGEGFWVNASAPVSLGTQSGVGFSLASATLANGWNLVATADDVSPATFSSNLGNVASLWAWDNSNSTWYFYTPSLTTGELANYIQSQSYKDFGAGTLGKGRGFWVNFTDGSGSFTGNIVLGSPDLASIKAKVYSANQSGSVYAMYGATSGLYDRQTPIAALAAGTPVELTMDGLVADSLYYYRLYYRGADRTSAVPTAEYSFHTARTTPSTFTFTLQADSHLDENSSLPLYRRTLANILADTPDFHIDLGDTFMTEKHAEPLSAVVQMAPNAATVNTRYAYEQSNFGLITHSVPLFLVNGNHDGELGWLNNGTAQNNAIWATQARQQYFPNPVPGAFYSGDSFAEPFVGERASWYAWRWGDAQFIVLDPYWKSSKQGSQDGWNLTLGERQYQWLATTLAASTAKYKFVFVHNLVGGLDGQMRGGIEAAPFFEWGGKNPDGSNGFVQKRAGWAMPIHQLLVQNRVTAVFHGHDHLYAKQDLDGIIYQEVPQPSASNTNSGAALASSYHYTSGTILSSSGHLRVTVTPSAVTGQYVRAWLPADETGTRKNRQVEDTWSVAAQ